MATASSKLLMVRVSVDCSNEVLVRPEGRTTEAAVDAMTELPAVPSVTVTLELMVSVPEIPPEASSVETLVLSAVAAMHV